MPLFFGTMVPMENNTPHIRADHDCLDLGRGKCQGPVEYRMPLSGTGRAFPRCDKHWEARLNEQQRITERYPPLPPSDFDPSYAGEEW